ncbi:MAG: CdaR family protein [Thermomicrobium sp.]|nr:CdaR family protein [Thermomicrobium sp.]
MTRLARMRARLLRVWDSLRPTLRRENVARLVIAFALAFALWAWVEATNDPETQRTISNIPVVPQGLSNDFVVTSDLPTVTVRIQGAQSRVQALESGSIQATVDLSDVREPGIYTRRVRVQLPGRLQLRQVIPPEVTLQVDRLAERSDVPVEVVVTNELPPNLELLSTSANPPTVTIRGPEQRVNLVARVSAPIQITGQTETVRESVTLVPVDQNGITVQGVTVEPSTASVTAQLRIRGQVRRVIPTIVGADRLAPGYELAGPPTVFPSDEVVVEGPESALAAIPYLTTTPIDVSGWSESRILWDVPIDTSRLPAGVRVEPATVNVSVQVRRAEETRTLQGIPIAPMNVRPGTTVDLSPSSVDVEFSGPSDVLDRIQPGDVLAFVDLENADVGIYQLPVRVTVPPNVRFERVTPEIVQVTVRAATPPAPSPTP